MLTKRDLLSSLAGLALGPVLLLGVAYLVGGKEVLAPLNEAADRMLDWIQRERQLTDPATGTISPIPEAVADHSAGMTMSVRTSTLPLLFCPRKDCPTVALIPAGGKVRMLGKRAADRGTEWSHVRFERQEGWVARHELE
jgi:hypothetical protein